MKNLKKMWGEFGRVILEPWTVVLIFSVALFFIFSPDQTNTTIKSLFFVLTTITSAILGGRVAKHWVDITEGGIVIARGKSAVRSLKLLLGNIFALEKRLAKFENSTDEIENHPEVTKRNYEEIRGICNWLEEETVNSIENWTDIIPEADIKTQIGVISELKQSWQETKYELKNKKKELNDTKDSSEEDRKKLKEEVKEKEKKITRLEKEIIERKTILGSSLNAHINFPYTVDNYTTRTGLLNIDTGINEHLSKHMPAGSPPYHDVITISKDIDDDLSKYIIDYKSKE